MDGVKIVKMLRYSGQDLLETRLFQIQDLSEIDWSRLFRGKDIDIRLETIWMNDNYFRQLLGDDE